ncbi:MAG: DUF362 domain-containing protein, partial [candidate division Zixibacteria bacterium]|nr:DUF362 domain-containing protein [candidate division Zixibacteria bacterium]
MAKNRFTRRQFIQSSIATLALAGLSELPRSKVLADMLNPYPNLAVVTDGGPAAITRKVMELLGGMKRFVSKGDIVVVKPNIGWDRTPEQGANTNPEVVAEIVKMCLEAGAKKVRVFDNSCNTAIRCYDRSGIMKAASRAGAEVSYMIEAGFSKVNFPQGEALKSWEIYKPALEADLLINVPIAKHHDFAGLTLGMKNLMGVMGGNRGKIHWNLDNSLVDLANFIKPRLTILDATRILLRNGPQGGDPKDVRKLDTIIAGTEIATVD